MKKKEVLCVRKGGGGQKGGQKRLVAVEIERRNCSSCSITSLLLASLNFSTSLVPPLVSVFLGGFLYKLAL